MKSGRHPWARVEHRSPSRCGRPRSQGRRRAGCRPVPPRPPISSTAHSPQLRPCIRSRAIVIGRTPRHIGFEAKTARRQFCLKPARGHDEDPGPDHAFPIWRRERRAVICISMFKTARRSVGVARASAKTSSILPREARSETANSDVTAMSGNCRPWTGRAASSARQRHIKIGAALRMVVGSRRIRVALRYRARLPSARRRRPCRPTIDRIFTPAMTVPRTVPEILDTPMRRR